MIYSSRLDGGIKEGRTPGPAQMTTMTVRNVKRSIKVLVGGAWQTPSFPSLSAWTNLWR